MAFMVAMGAVYSYYVVLKMVIAISMRVQLSMGAIEILRQTIAS